MEEYLGRRVGEIECEVQCIVFHSGCKQVQWMYLSFFVQSMLLVRWTIIDQNKHSRDYSAPSLALEH